MADPYDSDSAVEQILCEAMDLHVLEQISSINLSGVSSDALLPTDLETRFRKLKSFPAANPKRHNRQSPPPCLDSQIGEIPITPNSVESTPIPTSVSPDCQELDLRPKSRNNYVSSSSSEEEEESPPTPLCFWCSPKTKKVSTKKKNKERKTRNRGRVDDGDDAFALDSILSELNTLSLKQQKRSLRKAMMEQEKISRASGGFG